LPNWLTLPGGTVIVVVGSSRAVLVGAALLFAVYLVMHLLAPTSMGAGDVKAAIGLGGAAACAGPQAWVVAALLAPTITAVVGLATRRRSLPHGPSMCVAALVGILFAYR
jgi:leader peptidase (prepilin peptidase)/N-methyltransferase